MRLVFARDAEIMGFVVARVPHMDPQKEYAAIGVADDAGVLVAGCVYHGYSPRFAGLEMSIASSTPRWAQRGVIRALLSYPFLQLGCRRVTAVCPSDNARAIKFNLGIGFTREGTVRHLFAPRQHGVVCGFLRSDFDRLFRQEPGR